MELLDLAEKPKEQSVLVRLCKIVENSFDTDRPKMQHITHAEVARRNDITLRIFKSLRGDLSWGLTRIYDHLPRYLRAEIDGVPWKPETRSVWIPQDGQ